MGAKVDKLLISNTVLLYILELSFELFDVISSLNIVTHTHKQLYTITICVMRDGAPKAENCTYIKGNCTAACKV